MGSSTDPSTGGDGTLSGWIESSTGFNSAMGSSTIKLSKFKPTLSSIEEILLQHRAHHLCIF
jgi:hypothetical protein